MTNKTICTAALAAVIALSGCAERVVVHDHHPATVRYVPAPVQEVMPPAPAPGYAWVQGHWVWRDHGWQWQRGYWYQGPSRPMPAVIVEQVTVAPSPSHFWVPGHWAWRHNEWEWTRGHWER